MIVTAGLSMKYLNGIIGQPLANRMTLRRYSLSKQRIPLRIGPGQKGAVVSLRIK